MPTLGSRVGGEWCPIRKVAKQCLKMFEAQIDKQAWKLLVQAIPENDTASLMMGSCKARGRGSAHALDAPCGHESCGRVGAAALWVLLARPTGRWWPPALERRRPYGYPVALYGVAPTQHMCGWGSGGRGAKGRR